MKDDILAEITGAERIMIQRTRILERNGWICEHIPAYDNLQIFYPPNESPETGYSHNEIMALSKLDWLDLCAERGIDINAPALPIPTHEEYVRVMREAYENGERE